MGSSRTAGLVLALVLGAASAGLAQQPSERQHDNKSKQEWQGRRGRGGFGMLLKDIQLTDQQKAQLKELREKQRGEAGQGQRGDLREEVRTAREKGDTARLRELRAQSFARMQQHREEEIRAIRALLTPAQQTVFDRNVAEAKERFEKRGERFKEQRRS